MTESGCNMDGSGEGCEQLGVQNQLLNVMMLAQKHAMLSGPFTSSMTLKVMSCKRTFQRENLQKINFLSIVWFM